MEPMELLELALSFADDELLPEWIEGSTPAPLEFRIGDEPKPY
jgi:hypothetical protein